MRMLTAVFLLFLSQSALGDVFTDPATPILSKATVYGVTPDGTLYCYRHDGATLGTPDWSYGIPAGSGWTVHQVFSGAGAIYVIFENGELWWYKHSGYDTCSTTWLAGKRIGWGWQSFNQVVAVGSGVMYAFRTDGQVLWYRHLGFADGAMSWASGSGNVVATMGPIDYQLKVFSAGDGSMYLHHIGSTELDWLNRRTG